jgi:hypothetical protein
MCVKPESGFRDPGCALGWARSAGQICAEGWRVAAGAAVNRCCSPGPGGPRGGGADLAHRPGREVMPGAGKVCRPGAGKGSPGRESPGRESPGREFASSEAYGLGGGGKSASSPGPAPGPARALRPAPCDPRPAPPRPASDAASTLSTETVQKVLSCMSMLDASAVRRGFARLHPAPRRLDGAARFALAARPPTRRLDGAQRLVQRKPVASGAGASGLDGRPAGGCSSL